MIEGCLVGVAVLVVAGLILMINNWIGENNDNWPF